MAQSLGLGTWPLGGRAYGAVDEKAAAATIEAALDAGIRLFDTADIYGDGRVERLLGEILGDAPDAFVVTKVGYVSEAGDAQDFSHVGMTRAVEASLRRLRRSRIDVLLLHSPTRDVLGDPGALSMLDELRRAGVVGSTGVSLRTVDDFQAALAWPGCTLMELVFNLLDQRAIDLGALEYASRRGVEILARLPLCSGFLAGRYRRGATFPVEDRRSRWPAAQIDAWIDAADRFHFLESPQRSLSQAALSFCVAWPGVRVIPGMKSPVHVRDGVAAMASEHRLTAAELAAIREVWSTLRWLPPGAR